MVAVAILFPEVSKGHREGDLKEEQNRERGKEAWKYLEEGVPG